MTAGNPVSMSRSSTRAAGRGSTSRSARRLTAVENPVWAGLMASFVRRRGYSVEIVDAEADDLSPDQTAARIAELAPRLAAVVVYGHQPSASTQNMTGASAVTTAIRQAAPAQKVLMVGGPRRGAAGAHAGRGGVRLRRARRGALRHRRLDRRACAPRQSPTCRRCAGSSTDQGQACRQQSGRAAGDGRRDRDAGRCLGSAADGPVPRAQLALLRRSRAAAVRGDLHHARLSVPLLVLLHPGAVQGRRAGARHQGARSTATASGARRGSSRRSTCSSTGTASATSSSPTRCSCSTPATCSASATC